MVILPVLQKNDSYSDMKDKLREELGELEEALQRYQVTGSNDDREAVVAEVLDCIQVCLGMLDRLEQEGAQISQATHHHFMKLINRQMWVVKDVLRVDRLS